MTDVMTVGAYPDDPLPGPRMDWVYDYTITPIPPPRRKILIDPDYSVYRQPSPILESPMYFPGLAWKGTAGMPGRYGEVVYA
jgi:hypothetical protein